MPIGSFFALLDDITTQTKVAVAKTSTIVTDDLALNASMVTGIPSERERPVFLRIAGWSLLNKLVLGAAVMGINAVYPGMAVWMLIAGAPYLCHEGAEKVRHALGMDPHEKDEAPAKPVVEMTPDEYKAHEKSLIRNAVLTDVVLSAEIIVMGFNKLNPLLSLSSHVGAMGALAAVATLGVYGIAYGIVRIDDVAARFLSRKSDSFMSRALRKTGASMMKGVPHLLKGLSIAGTAAMFVVGGGILAEHLPYLREAVEAIAPAGFTGGVVELVAGIAAGIVSGAATMFGLDGAKHLYHRAQDFFRGPRPAKVGEKAPEPALTDEHPLPAPALRHEDTLGHAPDASRAMAEAAAPQKQVAPAPAPEQKRPDLQ